MEPDDFNATLKLLKEQIESRTKLPLESVTTIETLARHLRALGYAKALAFVLKIYMTPCIGNWSTLPWEMKCRVLAPLLITDCHLAYDNVDELATEHLGRFKEVGVVFRRECEQIFYQVNKVLLEPYKPSGTFSSLHFKYPPQRVNHYIKKVKYFGAQFQHHDGHRRDAWHFLKQVAVGTYGFQCVEEIEVNFEASEFQMQTFLNWNIQIETGRKRVDVCPADKGWEEKLQAAMDARKANWTRRGRSWPPNGVIGFRLWRELEKKG